MIQQTPSLQFGNVYVKMRGVHWLQCHPDGVPTKAIKEEIEDEFVNAEQAEGLVISTNHGVFRREPTIYWKRPNLTGNPLQEGSFDGLGVVLTGDDSKIVGNENAQTLVVELNRVLGGERAIVALQEVSTNANLTRETQHLNLTDGNKKTVIEFVGADVFDKEERKRPRLMPFMA